MGRYRTAALAVGLAGAVSARPVPAQIDYRNLDRERPLATEDAYPVERHAFELLLPLRTERERGGERLHLLPFELEYGIADNTQVALALPFGALETEHGGAVWGLAGLTASGLYNFNTESPTLPAVSIGADLGLPVGALAGDDARLSVRGIATRSWGFTRVHFNAVRSFGAENRPGAGAAPRWRYGLAADRTLFRQSLLFVGEVRAERERRGAEVELNAGVGVRYQLTPTLVLDAGVARRLRSQAGPDYDLTVGLAHVFGLSWLMPGRAR